MKKRDLLELLKDVKDDEELFVVSEDYVIDDDASWCGENYGEFKEVKRDGDDVYVVMNCKWFER